MVEKIAVIGGSGVYDLFDDMSAIDVDTPYGDVKGINMVRLEEIEIYFLSRHGSDHSVPPHKVNYRANIYAFFKLGVESIFSTNAVGSISPKIKPGHFVIPDQFIDMTKNRSSTFFDGDTTLEFGDGTIRNGVVHLDYTSPYCPRIRNAFVSLLRSEKKKVYDGGVYVCTEGPRFESSAEIVMYQKIGGTLVGMTTVPEATLAREAKICYATLCLVTNYGAGMQETVSHEEVVEVFRENINVIQRVLKSTITHSFEEPICDCRK